MTTREDLTYKYNMKENRHGWLRLTPAYSVKMVHQILDKNLQAHSVLDPFSGTGTTGLVCRERGIACDLLDINPFLIWFAKAKTANYSQNEIDGARQALHLIQQRHGMSLKFVTQVPRIQNIDRWWHPSVQYFLASLYQVLHNLTLPTASRDLLLVAFCQKIIAWSSAAFNHQSMSFKVARGAVSNTTLDHARYLQEYIDAAKTVITSAAQPVHGLVTIKEADSRRIPYTEAYRYDCVITSPPYPNRMSYIRELRPYMYWLGYLQEAREAGELDWQAIGGTWGIATSRVAKWEPNGRTVPYEGFLTIIDAIATKSSVLAKYVHKYFLDITLHVESLVPMLAPNAKIYYIVGNSKFYDTLLPVEKIFADIFRSAGFKSVEVEVVRKRNSKKELFEYVVSASSSLH